jgi:glutathione S-transferase
MTSRVAQLAAALGDRDRLEDGFTIGDPLMIDVLRHVPEPDLFAPHPNLAAYVERGMARPAFKTALMAQMAVFQQLRR